MKNFYIFLIIFLIIVFIGGGIGLWYFFIRKKKKPPKDGKKEPPEEPPSQKGRHQPTENQKSRIRVQNAYNEDIWIQHNKPSNKNSPNYPDNDNNYKPIPDDEIIQLSPGNYHDYEIDDCYNPSLRLWPKTKCDADGNNCLTGQSKPPCPKTGCSPPFESKVEFTLAYDKDGKCNKDKWKKGSSKTWYNISFVDGYTLPTTIFAKDEKGNIIKDESKCSTINCENMDISKCPENEELCTYGCNNEENTRVSSDTFNLKVNSGKEGVIGCLSPCQKSVSVKNPYGGLNRDIDKEPSLHMCCPTPKESLYNGKVVTNNCRENEGWCINVNDLPENSNKKPCTWKNNCASPKSCSNPNDKFSVVNTDYHNTVKNMCKNAYTYAYSETHAADKNQQVLFKCSPKYNYEVVFG